MCCAGDAIASAANYFIGGKGHLLVKSGDKCRLLHRVGLGARMEVFFSSPAGGVT